MASLAVTIKQLLRSWWMSPRYGFVATLTACLLQISAPAHAQVAANAQAPAPFLMAADAEPKTYAHTWITLIYKEVFRRLGVPVQIGTYPLARRAAMVADGQIDGEVSRVYAYGDANPHLIRVEESIVDFTFVLFTAKPGLSLQRIEDLATGNSTVEYRRGILMCENSLKKIVPEQRLSDIGTTVQGVKKLLAGRVDVYCDIDTYVLEALNAPDLKGTKGVRPLIKLASVPTYPYLNKRHADLAPRMAAVLKQMKTEGLIETYRLQAEREMGWR